jgi:aryl-alcohol dehydrogenase-like predicted oxidoreductase
VRSELGRITRHFENAGKQLLFSAFGSFVRLQIEYSLTERTVERELIPLPKALNIGVTAWSPLAGGVLSGKYHGHGTSDEGRMNSDMLKERRNP